MDVYFIQYSIFISLMSLVIFLVLFLLSSSNAPWNSSNITHFTSVTRTEKGRRTAHEESSEAWRDSFVRGYIADCQGSWIA